MQQPASDLNDSAPLEMPSISGKWVVLTIFFLAVAMAAFAVWWNYERGRRSLALWGKDGALLIRGAKKVELLRLARDSPAHDKPPEAGKIETAETSERERLTCGGETYRVMETKDVSQAQGLIHARSAFLDDASFDWTRAPAARAEYGWAVRFSEGTATATILLDVEHRQALLAESGRAAIVVPKITSGWKTFSDRHLEPAVTKIPPAP